MLEKTLKLLDGIVPGSFVPDERVCFDEAEVKTLATLLQRLVYAPSQIRRRLQEHGVTVIPSNGHSQIPTVGEIESSYAHHRTGGFDYIFDKNHLQDILRHLLSYSLEFNPELEKGKPGQFFWKNSQFSYSDAMSYYCMIRSRMPKTVIEIGGSYCTSIAIEALRMNGRGRIVRIETPGESLTELGDFVTEIEKRPIQDLSPNFFNERLQSGDILFIDSSHTVKHDSDCIHIYLKLLPYIMSQITIHAHDIFLPNSLSLQMMRDLQIHWTEQYLLYAYILENNRTKVCYSSTYNDIHHKALLDAMMHGRYGSGGGSIWFDQGPPT